MADRATPLRVKDVRAEASITDLTPYNHVSGQTRFAPDFFIDVTRGFTGAKSTQAFIDEAARAYLLNVRATMPHYRIAAEALDAELCRGASNVASLDQNRRGRSP